MVNAVKMSDKCSLVLAQIPWWQYCSLIMYIIRSYSVTKCIPLFYCSVTAFQHLVDCTKPRVYAVSRAHGCQIHHTKTSKHFPAGIFPDKSGSNAIFNTIIGLPVVWTYHCTSSYITFMKSTDMCFVYIHCKICSRLNPGFLHIFFSCFLFGLY